MHDVIDKRARWVFRSGALLVVVGCGWAWLPLGFMAAGAMLCVAVVTHVVAKAAKDAIEEGRMTDGETSNGTDKP